MESASEVTEEVEEHLRDQPWILVLVRAGWVAKAIVYAAIGWGAWTIGNRSGPTEDADAEYTGIVTLLADGPMGRFALAVLAVGLIFYVVFRVLSVLLIDEHDADAWAHRIGYTFSAITYLLIAWVAGRAALEGPPDKGESTVTKLSRALLESGVGRLALVVGGLVAIGIAIYFVVKGVSRRFLDELDLDEASEPERTAIEWLGAIGWVGRALVVGVVSAVVTWAAIDADPSDATGLDRTLHRLADTWLGQLLVLSIGVLLFVYAFYCLASARYRSPRWND